MFFNLSAQNSSTNYPNTPSKSSDRNFGIFSGYSYSIITNKEKINEKSPNGRHSFHFGVSYQLSELVDHLIFEPNIRYSQKGIRYEGIRLDNNTTLNYMNNYFSYLDIIAKSKLDIPDFPIYPFIGFSSGILLSAKSDIKSTYKENNATYYEYSETIDLKKDCSTLDFGFLLGVDLVLQKSFFIGLEYNLSLNSFDHDTNDKSKHQTMFVYIGLLY